MTHFRWHGTARLIGPDGRVQAPVAFDPLPGEGPGALASVLAAEGRPFRIGGEGALEAGPGEFETLTGGSLGNPRRVIRTQQSWLESFQIDADLFGIGPGVRLAVTGRLVHSLALYGALCGLCLGAEVHLLDGLRPDRQARALAARRVGLVFATPAQLRPIVAAGQVLPELSCIIVGGSRLDPALRSGLSRIAPAAGVHEFYGAAETSFVTLARPGDAEGTVGHAYPGVELRLDPGGLVWVRSPYLFRRYAGPDPGSAYWDGDWLTVGEVGEMTPAGLILRGRAGRMLTVADRNVFPEEIEVFLLSLPGVERAAVLPVEDPARGAVLVAHLAGDPRQEASILLALRHRLGPLIAPKRLFWRRDWPVLPSGKTDLTRLAVEAAGWR